MFRSFLVCALTLALVHGDTTPAVYQPSPTQSYKPDPSPSYQQPSSPFRSNHYNEPQQEYSGPPQPYAFNYGVADDYSGANFKAEESADGKAVSGSYQVALPDGRIQTVRYTVDGYNGFVADVQYEGTPIYPKYEPKESSYKVSPSASFRTPPPYVPPSPSSPPQYKPAKYTSNPATKFKSLPN